jgi:LPXTG-motif cell wall-anchored protein
MFGMALVAPQVILAQEAPEDPAAVEEPAPPSVPTDPAAPPEPADPTDPSAPAPVPGETPPQEPDAGTEPAVPPEEDEPAVVANFVTKKAKSGKAAKAAKASQTVRMLDLDFSPATVSINVGDTITWTNDSETIHDAVADDGSFDTGTVRSGQSASHTFTEAGTFGYVCTFHESAGMKGTITVADSGTSGKTDTSGTSEADAVTQPDAAGTSTSLPSTGSDELPLAVVGILLLAVGLLARLGAGAQRVSRPR